MSPVSEERSCFDKVSMEKRFYNRETDSTVFCVIQQMSIKPPFPSMQIQSSQPIMNMGWSLFCQCYGGEV